MEELSFLIIVLPPILFYWFFLKRKESKGEIEKHWLMVPLIYAFIGWFFHVPWLGIEPSTLVYRDDALTNWATGPQPFYFIFKY